MINIPRARRVPTSFPGSLLPTHPEWQNRETLGLAGGGEGSKLRICLSFGDLNWSGIKLESKQSLSHAQVGLFLGLILYLFSRLASSSLLDGISPPHPHTPICSFVCAGLYQQETNK